MARQFLLWIPMVLIGLAVFLVGMDHAATTALAGAAIGAVGTLGVIFDHGKETSS